MSRRVVISGAGPISGLGIGIDATWQAACEGRSAIGRIERFDPGGFACQIGAEVRDLKVNNFVPKSYRKATKVMARDIALAVAAADLAAQDARLVTKGTVPDATKGDPFVPTYAPQRMGTHIGAGLIAAELDELTAALVEARASDGTGQFDMHRWGCEGMNHLTPLWLLKYLPNMLACHVTIIHGTQGPSNTITCSEASSVLSIGESLRVIQRGSADVCFCGGLESKLNPMALLRQHMTHRLNTTDNDNPAGAVRPFCQTAAGTALGEGGAIVVLESFQTFGRRAQNGVKAYAEVIGFGASQSVDSANRNLNPEPGGIARSIRSALRDASLDAEAIDLIIPSGLGAAELDAVERNALAMVFGDRLSEVPIISPKALVGSCGAGAGGLDVVMAAKALAEQVIPAVINCPKPWDGLNAGTSACRPASLQHALTFSGGTGGQNAALILRCLP